MKPWLGFIYKADGTGRDSRQRALPDSDQTSTVVWRWFVKKELGSGCGDTAHQEAGPTARGRSAGGPEPGFAAWGVPNQLFNFSRIWSPTGEITSPMSTFLS